MKNTLLPLILILLALNSFAQSTDKLTTKYLEIKNALVNSNFKEAAKAATAFQENLKNETGLAENTTLHTAIDNLLKANNIEKQRNVFKDLSATFWKVEKNNKSTTKLYYQYCPMKNAYWISSEKEIKNPYLGSKMPDCGSVKETFK